jgi:hypothetical protein
VPAHGRSRVGPRLLGVLTACVALALAVAAAEVVARLRPPPAEMEPLDRNVPTLHEPDAELGWRNKAGRFVWPGRNRDAGRDIVMTFWPDGLRATGPTQRRGRPQLVVVGCSFTQGWALTDEDTYPWRLQTAFPDLEVLNYGTAGYGTYQSLLALERHLARSTTPPAMVVYGLIEFHEERNVLPADWLHALRRATVAGPQRAPFVSLAPDGNLVRHPPEGWPEWPLDGVLASVRLLEDRWVEYRTRGRAAQEPAALEALVAEMARDTTAAGTRFLVAILDTMSNATRERYDGFLDARGIARVDCLFPNRHDIRFKVPGYGHPNGIVDAFWSDCIAARLRELGLQ